MSDSVCLELLNLLGSLLHSCISQTDVLKRALIVSLLLIKPLLVMVDSVLNLLGTEPCVLGTLGNLLEAFVVDLD